MLPSINGGVPDWQDSPPANNSFLQYSASAIGWSVIDLATYPFSNTLPISKGGTGSATQNFVDLTTNQTIAGEKTFSGTAYFGSLSGKVIFQTYVQFVSGEDASLTGSNQEFVVSGTQPQVIFTNASLASIASIDKGSTGSTFLIFVNNTGSTISIVNEYLSATAAKRIVTGTGGDINLSNGASIILSFNGITSRWHVVGGTGSGSGGAFVSDTFSGTSISATLDGFQKWLYNGGSAQTLSSISTGSLTDGEILNIIGSSDTNTITANNNDTSGGWLLNGSWTGYKGSVLSLQWEATLDRFVEVSRS